MGVLGSQLKRWLCLCVEDVGEGAGEAGQHFAAVKDVVVCDSANDLIGLVDVDAASVGVDYPYEVYAVAEPHCGSIRDVAAAVAWGI